MENVNCVICGKEFKIDDNNKIKICGLCKKTFLNKRFLIINKDD